MTFAFPRREVVSLTDRQASFRADGHDPKELPEQEPVAAGRPRFEVVKANAKHRAWDMRRAEK